MNRTDIKKDNKDQSLKALYDNFPKAKELIKYIRRIHLKGGPEEEEYILINEVLNHYRQSLSPDEVIKLQKKIAGIFGSNFIHSTTGHAMLQPYNYAGDFEIIDKMYQEYISEFTDLVKWDKFYHSQAAAKAVRNRKTFFKSTLNQKINEDKSSFEVLNIASGPCRDIYEFYKKTKNKRTLFTCVETDLNAILYATKLNHQYLPQFTFFHQSIFKFETERKFDLIWSAGLFDYFDDKIFIRLLSKLKKNVKLGGEIIIGNFSDKNPTISYMELFIGWHLHHRTEEQLIELAQAAGIQDIGRITIEREAEGVNLFMRIQF